MDAYLEVEHKPLPPFCIQYLAQGTLTIALLFGS